MSSILSFIGWAVLPNYVTSILQNVYYGITIRAGDPRPQPGSPRYAKHRRRIFIFVITTYLLYTLYESFYQIRAAGDFYRLLGVSPRADEKAIKSRFRRLAAQHHPDKVTNGESAGADAFFVYLKQAQDTLLDPARRFAYDRFGPDVVQWRNRETMQDFLYAALTQALTQYAAGFVIIVLMNFFLWGPWGRYPVALFDPASYLPSGLRSLLKVSTDSQTFYLLPFQIISLARRVSITIHIFISQLDVAKGSSPAGAPGTLSAQSLQRLGQLVQLSQVADREATRLLQLGFAPFRGDRESVATLRRSMKEGLVLGSVRNSQEVQEAVAQVRQRKRRGNLEEHKD
ncbi:Membrane associated DnaJ chaperone [Rasamsonia emersonii CBS 393.64]|uniref:Membrane associated DnaJ chaperone n=1 Tax=Rasamsonia emersonii (strain ATCC 16479 / CBS 393.64 / IMI 116815) TaxID=1408163 RepID=A0A0F4YK10_RASE3|nr:Membrane associated DnaJ chaperone [Rasamsonia emersonii CBS 393.64]KKA18569.1 Membrane associated DnaJ chaperone [Rasamsonia emersonii CBS 393.64]